MSLKLLVFGVCKSSCLRDTGALSRTKGEQEAGTHQSTPQESAPADSSVCVLT